MCLCERGASGGIAGGVSVYVHVFARVCVCVKGVQVGIQLVA